MKAVGVLALVLTTGAWAETAAEPSLARVRAQYDHGEFGDVEDAVQALLDRGELTVADLVEAHLYAGLAAFNLEQKALVDRHFGALLRLSPDYAPDPFLAPPPAIRAFTALKERMAPELQRLRLERARPELSGRSQLESSAERASQHQVGPRSLWVDFVPFGAGQFQQGRVGAGVAFATTEALLAAASLVTYFVYNGLNQTTTLPVNNQSLGGSGTLQITGIPRAKQHQAEVLRGFNLGTSIGAYTVYASGVVEALIRHKEGENAAPPPPPPPTVDLRPAGAGMQLSLRF